MRLALIRLKDLGWMALICFVAVLLYPLSLSVGTTRSQLERTESDIVRTRMRIDYLETEFAARSNMIQLQLWNDLNFGYVSPTAAQYLQGERALANLGAGVEDLDRPVLVAALTAGSDIKPAGFVGSPMAGIARAEASPVSDTVVGAGDAVRAPSTPSVIASNETALAVKSLPAQSDASRRAAFAAQMDIALARDRSIARANPDSLQ